MARLPSSAECSLPSRAPRLRLLLLVLPAVLWACCARPALGIALRPLRAATMVDQWVSHGGDLYNRRWAEGETRISPATAGALYQAWKFPTEGDVTATPAVADGVVYFPDWSGRLYALLQDTGEVLWVRSFAADYGFAEGTKARATPAVALKRRFGALPEDLLVIGINKPGYVIAVSAATGALVWKTEVDPHFAAKITGAATVYQDAAFLGVSSDEEEVATDPNYKCCTFVGTLVKLSLLDGAVLWRAYMVPEGYSGGAIWGGSPTIDPKRQIVMAGVGNLYDLPPEVQACIEANPNRGSPDPCIFFGNHQNAIVGLNSTTGEWLWSTPLGPIDAANLACGGPNPGPNCPADAGPDYDFGLNPLALTIKDPRPGFEGQMVDAAIAGQKSGIVFALEVASGAVLWTTAAGPGGSLGGISWGLATDGERIFAGVMNSDEKPFYLPTINATITSGAWVALDANTGVPLWYTPNPNAKPSWAMLPSAANGVVFAGSSDPMGHMYALDAVTGAVLWEFSPGASVYGGVSVSRGCIYFGYGYGAFKGPFGTTGGGPQNLFSFCAP